MSQFFVKSISAHVLRIPVLQNRAVPRGVGVPHDLTNLPDLPQPVKLNTCLLCEETTWELRRHVFAVGDVCMSPAS